MLTCLLARADDMGATHAANTACLKTYREGIVRSAEVIVPGPWFDEAATLLAAEPGLDAGVHLTLTSEWAGCRWRPLTAAPELCDPDGCFPMLVWPDARFPAEAALRARPWTMEAVEAEWRAQIETAQRRLPRLSHLTTHMGCESLDPRLPALLGQMETEYGLAAARQPLQPLRPWTAQTPLAARTDALTTAIETLGPGKHLLVDHPGDESAEMRALANPALPSVAAERAQVTATFTAERVLAAVRRRGIRLIGYREGETL
jgi:predicted glycoside hydrolase/deacetylase ChbG (UPF0249 family)